MQWIPQAQVPMAQPVAYHQVVARPRSPSPTRRVAAAPFQVVRVAPGHVLPQRATMYPGQVPLAPGSPPAPVLLQRHDVPLAWKEMQLRLGSPPLSDRATLRPVVSPTASPVPSPAVPLRTPEVHRPEVRPEVRPEGRPEQAVVEKSPSGAGRSPTPPVPEQIDLPWTRLASEALEPVPQLSGRQEGASRAEAKKLSERAIEFVSETASDEAKARERAWCDVKAQAAQELPKKKRSEKRPGSGEVKAPGSSRQHKAFEKAEKKASPRAEKPVESSLSAWKKSQQLQFGRVKTDDEDGTQNFCREMFISRRQGRPEDHYRVLGILGRGSFGVVRKVQCRQTKAMRVMKIVDKQKALSGGYPLKLIMEEIDKLKSLDHPAVLRLFEYYADSRSLYLITDLLPGGDLLEAVERSYGEKKQLPEAWVAAVFRQACEGTAYCHAKGVMHKDLKLENIMLCSVDPPEAVVIDVGLAELFPPSEAESFKSADAAGTLATMAPEVIRGSFNAKCDVWSLGCCLYALLCTRPRRLKDSVEETTAEDESQYYNYFYPFRPPLGESRSELKAYLEQQKRGPDLARLRCSALADDLVKEMLAYDEPGRSQMQQILTHRWLQSRDREQVLGAGQVDSLLQFHRTNALAQAVLLDMASQLPLAQLRELTQLFESMDKDGNGMLDRGELTEGLTKAGLQPEQARQAAVRLLRDGGGSVEFSRFVAALVPSCRDLLSAKLLRSSFDRLDENGDGFVSRAELQRLLERAGSKLAQAQQQLADREKTLQKASTSHLEGEEVVEVSSEEGSPTTSGSKRLRAAQAARKAFDNISGEGRVRVSFESLHRLLGGNFS